MKFYSLHQKYAIWAKKKKITRRNYLSFLENLNTVYQVFPYEITPFNTLLRDMQEARDRYNELFVEIRKIYPCLDCKMRYNPTNRKKDIYPKPNEPSTQRLTDTGIMPRIF